MRICHMGLWVSAPSTALKGDLDPEGSTSACSGCRCVGPHPSVLAMPPHARRLGHRARIVIDTMLPSNAHPALPLGALDTDFDRFYEDFSRTSALPMRLAFGAAVFAATWIAPLLIGRLPPLTRHARGERERALQALTTSRSSTLRQLAVVMKTVISFCYGSDPRVRRAIGHR